MRSTALAGPLLLLLALAAAVPPAAAQADTPLTQLSRERVVFQTAHGDIHFGFYPKVRCAGVQLLMVCVWKWLNLLPCVPLMPCLPSSRCATPRASMCLHPQAAPRTVEHIKRCVELGLYNTNHIFRVDKGFVAQVDGVERRTAPMSSLQRVSGGGRGEKVVVMPSLQSPDTAG